MWRAFWPSEHLTVSGVMLHQLMVREDGEIDIKMKREKQRNMGREKSKIKKVRED